MRNNFNIYAYLVGGLFLILLALLLFWNYGDDNNLFVSAILLLIAGGFFCLLFGINYIKESKEQDFFHLD